MSAMWEAFDSRRPLHVLVAAVTAGVIAGLLASVVLTFTAEPVVEEAIRFEESHRSTDATAEAEIVSRPAQKGLGRFAGYGLGGGVYGTLLGVAFLALRRRHGERGGTEGAFRQALVAASIVAGAFTLVPFVKYPPNPPGIGDPATLAERQWQYVLLIFLALVVLSGGVRLSTWLQQRRWTGPHRSVAVGFGVAVPLALVLAALPPSPDAVVVPAAIVWRFRLASLGGNLVLWGVLTAAFALVVASERHATLKGNTLAEAVHR